MPSSLFEGLIYFEDIGYIIVKGRPCKVAKVSTSNTRKHGHAKFHFVASDILMGKILKILSHILIIVMSIILII